MVGTLRGTLYISANNTLAGGPFKRIYIGSISYVRIGSKPLDLEGCLSLSRSALASDTSPTGNLLEPTGSITFGE